jgi:hypothetical protein
VLGHGSGVFFAAVFQCSPVQYTWDKTIVGGSCFNQQAFYRYVSLPNILTDFVILIMPMPVVWKLQTRLTHKVALTGVFLLGGLYAPSNTPSRALRDCGVTHNIRDIWVGLKLTSLLSKLGA